VTSAPASALVGLIVVVAAAPTPSFGAQQSSVPTLRYEVEGVEVLHRVIHTNDLVAVNVYLLGGAQQLDERTQGIEPFLLFASERGTESFPGTEAQEAMVRTGSRVVVSAGPDWTVFGFRGLAEEFENTWAVFADRLTRPTLDSRAIEVARSQLLASARAQEDDPDGAVRLQAESVAYASHVYRFQTYGTEASLDGLTAEDLREYLSREVVKSRLLIVVVGNVSRERVESMIRETLSSLPPGTFAWRLPPPWTHARPGLEVESRALPTNYIVGYFSGPPASSEEREWLRLATSVLSSIVFREIRSEGLSYSAGAYGIDRGASGGVIYVSSLFPKKSMETINEVIDFLGQAQFGRSELRDYTKRWKMEYYLRNETNAEQAGFIGPAYLYRGVVQSPEEYVETLLEVSPNDLRRAVVRYVKNIQYAYLGDLEKVPRDQMGVP